MLPDPITCLKLPSPPDHAEPSSPPAWSNLFSPVALQPCGTGNETPFRPSLIHTAWDDEQLHVFAHLEDDDIFNTSQSEPSPTWTTGDVFEVFLQPPPGPHYHEIHVTPDNVQLRIFINAVIRDQKVRNHIPGTPALGAASIKKWLEESQLPSGTIGSRTHVSTSGKFWNIDLRIPFRSLSALPPQPGQQWKALFSRYDCTRGIPLPQLSASSPQAARPNFHDRSRWHSLIFE